MHPDESEPYRYAIGKRAVVFVAHEGCALNVPCIVEDAAEDRGMVVRESREWTWDKNEERWRAMPERLTTIPLAHVALVAVDNETEAEAAERLGPAPEPPAPPEHPRGNPLAALLGQGGDGRGLVLPQGGVPDAVLREIKKGAKE